MVVHAGTWLLLSCWVLGTAAHGSHEVRGHDEIECSTESDFSDADLQAIHGLDYYRRRLQTLGPDATMCGKESNTPDAKFSTSPQGAAPLLALAADAASRPQTPLMPPLYHDTHLRTPSTWAGLFFTEGIDIDSYLYSPEDFKTDPDLLAKLLVRGSEE